MSAVEQYVRAHVVTDALDEDRGAVPVVLRYDPERAPRCVRVRPPGPGAREWTVERELLEQGLRVPAGTGGVRVWPCGRVQTVVEFHSAPGVLMVQFETRTLERFLRRTHVAEPVPH